MSRLAIAVLIFATAVSASASSKELVDKLGQSSDLLKAAKYAEALKLDDEAIGDMLEHYVSGDATTQLFCIAVTHKALALAGLGRGDDAFWYWALAKSLYPPIAKSDMSDYGAAGEFLKRMLPATPWQEVDKPPAIRKKVEPVFPNQTLNAMVEGPIRIEVVVGKDGKPRAPLILDSLGAPMLAYATAEAVRLWQFTPATAGGQPVEARFIVQMTYKVR